MQGEAQPFVTSRLRNRDSDRYGMPATFALILYTLCRATM